LDPWIDAKARYGDGGAEIHFSSHIIPYLTKLREGGNFTIYQLENIGGLKSAYSIRMYELLVQYKTLGSRDIPLSELRKMLCLGDKYKTMSNLKTWVIDLSIKEINEHTNIQVSYKNIKRGRAITGFSFTIKTKKKAIPKPKNNKKWLTEADINRIAQEPRFSGKSWLEVYDRLEKDDYSFNRKHK